MISKGFQPTPEMHYQAVREISGFDRELRLIPLIWLGFAILWMLLGLIRLNQNPGDVPISAIVFFMLGAVALLYQFVLSPQLARRRVARSVRRTPSAMSAQVFDISPEGIRNHGEGFSSEFAWSALTKVRVSNTLVLFFVSPRAAHYVPKELFSPEELQQILRWGER